MTTALPETEAGFTDRVLETARHYGWRRHHQRPALRRNGRYVSAIQGDTGFPDLVLVRGGRCIIAEVKTDRGRLTEAQRRWGEALFWCGGVEYYVWRPRDWETIVQILERNPRRKRQYVRAAERRRERPALTRRACLRCDREFWSQGCHHRLCDACRHALQAGEGAERTYRVMTGRYLPEPGA